MSDYYEILGVPRDATPEAIKRAYRTLSRQHHPDREGGDHDTMANITTAYRILSDPEKRAHYDKTGGEKNLNSVEVMAAQMIAEAFSNYLDAETDEDPVIRIRENIAKTIRSTEVKVSELRQSIRRITRKAKRVIRKKGGEDLYATVVRMKLQKLELEISGCNSYIEMANAGIELLDGYEFKGVEPDQPSAAVKEAHARLRQAMDAQLFKAFYSK